MKIPPYTPLKSGANLRWLGHREDGMACLVMISLLAIMMILSMEELRCLAHLRREIKFQEKQQVQRLVSESARHQSVKNHTAAAELPSQ